MILQGCFHQRLVYAHGFPPLLGVVMSWGIPLEGQDYLLLSSPEEINDTKNISNSNLTTRRHHQNDVLPHTLSLPDTCTVELPMYGTHRTAEPSGKTAHTVAGHSGHNFNTALMPSTTALLWQKEATDKSFKSAKVMFLDQLDCCVWVCLSRRLYLLIGDSSPQLAYPVPSINT